MPEASHSPLVRRQITLRTFRAGDLIMIMEARKAAVNCTNTTIRALGPISSACAKHHLAGMWHESPVSIQTYRHLVGA